jgi:hypothetical protein
MKKENTKVKTSAPNCVCNENLEKRIFKSSKISKTTSFYLLCSEAVPSHESAQNPVEMCLLQKTTLFGLPEGCLRRQTVSTRKIFEAPLFLIFYIPNVCTLGGWKGETLPTGLAAPPPIPPALKCASYRAFVIGKTCIPNLSVHMCNLELNIVILLWESLTAYVKA